MTTGLEIKAIQTQYKGYRFRSRLEARWAVFFDAMGYQWEYEPQGYLLAGKVPYLPDFWLPGFGVFAEVKPDLSKDHELFREELPRAWKVFDLAIQAERAGVLLVGAPHLKLWPFVAWSPFDWNSRRVGGLRFGSLGPGSPELFFHPIEDMSDEIYNNPQMYCPRYLNAVDAARSARFEHGESGARI